MEEYKIEEWGKHRKGIEMMGQNRGLENAGKD